MNKFAKGRTRLPLKGRYSMRLIRNGIVVLEERFKNLVTHVGLEYLFGAGLTGVTPSTTWYMSLINNAGSPAPALTDEMSSHASWTEFTSYDEANRITVDFDAPGAVTPSLIETDTTCNFTISATGTVFGAFIADENTKSGATGILLSAGGFASPLNVQDDDVLQIGYSLTR